VNAPHAGSVSRFGSVEFPAEISEVPALKDFVLQVVKAKVMYFSSKDPFSPAPTGGGPSSRAVEILHCKGRKCQELQPQSEELA